MYCDYLAAGKSAGDKQKSLLLRRRQALAALFARRMRARCCNKCVLTNIVFDEFADFMPSFGLFGGMKLLLTMGQASGVFQ